jgi:hypothetical protein
MVRDVGFQDVRAVGLDEDPFNAYFVATREG